MDVVDEVNPPFNVDIVVAEPDRELREELTREILGAHVVLYGTGKYVLNYAKVLKDLTFEEARSALRVAQRILQLAVEVDNPLDRDRLIREAFGSLFHVTRIAVVVYLFTEVARWGQLRRMLPKTL